MNRGFIPYRISLSERMNRYRPPLHSLEEEDQSELIISVHGQRRPLRIKPFRRTHARFVSRHEIQGSSSHNSGELQIIPSEVWASHMSRYSSWQPDVPEITITSDVQLQTEDSDMVEPIVYPSTSTSRTRSNYETMSTVEEHYPSRAHGASINMTDRSTQIPDEPRESTSRDAAMPEAKSVAAPPSHAQVRKARALPPLPTATVESRQVANRVIKHARKNKTVNEKLLRCPNCKLLPSLPVTGQCGHTRCTRCIKVHGACPCGVEAPETLHVNTVIQYILNKMVPNITRRLAITTARPDVNSTNASAIQEHGDTANGEHPRAHSSHQSRSLAIARARGLRLDISCRVPLTPVYQYDHARRLLFLGRGREAAPHFARVAASADPVAHQARVVLSQLIVAISEDRDPRRLTRELFRSVRSQSAATWLYPSDLECVLCFHTFTRPVTTPCGHTYCKTCIERALDYKKTCALCQRSLDGFDLIATGETVAVNAALDAIDAASEPLPPDPDVIPIFVCTVAYPSIPCPLFIFDPRYWLMIRRVLDSESRTFGMVAYERNRTYSDYGTILEVRDCVHLEDGRSFLSTIGVGRFRIMKREVRDGCDVARIQPLIDLMPMDQKVVLEMSLMGTQILYKALCWLENMDLSVRGEIETAFGQIPHLTQREEEWWTMPDGPAWLWWLIAILPLRPEIKVLILKTRNLRKRMLAVARTLEAIDQASITTTATSECEIRSALTNAEEWLERGS